jgi:ABC-type dipeptide/oligopeptide/nickel transport system permease subunit
MSDTKQDVNFEDEQSKLAYYEASQWTLMRRRFAKHKVAAYMLWVVVLFYLLCMNCEFFAPYDPNDIHKDWINMPPQSVRFSFGDGLYVHPYTLKRDPVTLRRQYVSDTTQRTPIRLLIRGRTWKFLGLIETDLHLFGVEPKPMLGVAAAGMPPVRVTIEVDPDAAGTQHTLVTFIGANPAALGVRSGDRLHLRLPGDEEATEFRIARVDPARPVVKLYRGPPGPVTEGREAEVWRRDTAFLLGTGGLGQDVLSRILYGGRISLSIGFIGVTLTFILGITLGGISGYFGGKIDMVIQRVAEILQTVPKIPIWITMAAAIPRDWTSLQVYFIMTLILACMGWTGLCRVVRGKLLALREEDYARAAQLAGASEMRVIFRHLVPNFTSHIIASLTLRIPAMILAETSLSFLGIGLRPPIVSWGVLLKEVDKAHIITNAPWLLLPAGMVILAVLAFNFVGEGLRDAADPYAT